jgi:hypothetical protein
VLEIGGRRWALLLLHGRGEGQPKRAQNGRWKRRRRRSRSQNPPAAHSWEFEGSGWWAGGGSKGQGSRWAELEMRRRQNGGVAAIGDATWRECGSGRAQGQACGRCWREREGGGEGWLGWRSRRSAETRGDSSQPAANKKRQTNQTGQPAAHDCRSLTCQASSHARRFSLGVLKSAHLPLPTTHCRHSCHSCQSSLRNPPAATSRPPCLRCHGARSMQPQSTTWRA